MSAKLAAAFRSRTAFLVSAMVMQTAFGHQSTVPLALSATPEHIAADLTTADDLRQFPSQFAVAACSLETLFAEFACLESAFGHRTLLASTDSASWAEHSADPIAGSVAVN